ncbi:serine hydrolase domain-containing protein [Haloplanus sp. GCM10025708]|uniref:serine hydrolase domain-containing protein n=1 Tax=Haloplanus sp. GCM10025708 TaxID=3252679 RepID=UPI0036189026
MPERGDVDAETTDAIDAFVCGWLSENGVPGASIALVTAEESLYTRGYGARDLRANDPSTPRTLYGIGSITKSMTALSILQLAERGELSVSDSIADHLPELRALEADGEITIADLLTHSSGLPSDGSAHVLLSRGIGADPFPIPLSSRDDYYRYLRATAGDRVSDDDAFFYYNSGYFVLGCVVEEITGQEYDDYVRQNVLEPLGMERATFTRDEFESDPDRMTPYLLDEGTPTPATFPFYDVVQAAGGLLASVEELGAYLQCFLGDDCALVSDEAVAEMHEHHATWNRAIDGTEQGYGYGWMVGPFDGDRLVGHLGDVTVSTSYVGFLEQQQVGIAVSCNTAPPCHPINVGKGVLALLNGETPERAVSYFGLREKRRPLPGSTNPDGASRERR